MPHANGTLPQGPFQEMPVLGSALSTLITSAVTSIFLQLKDHSLSRPDGTIYWLAPESNSSTSQQPPRALGPYLYDGSTGAAMFLAAYYHATGDQESRELALRAVGPLAAKLATLPGAQAGEQRAFPISGFNGFGGLAYALAQMSRWLDSVQLMQSASAALRSISHASVERDEALDVVNGCAGTLLSMLAFCDEENIDASLRNEALSLGIACAHRLLNARTSLEGKPRAWPGKARLPISGFAHGAAGIACSLWELATHTGDEHFRAAACEGFAFEHSLYDPRQKKWFDPRFNRLQQHAAWCHGAPGIALGRLRCFSALEACETAEDLEQALAITRAVPEFPVDDLCCGNFGRVEILHTAGRLLRRPELVHDSLNLAETILMRAATHGFSFFADPTDSSGKHTTTFNPTFFRGVAGVGYSLLRLLYPEMFACVLLLETQN